MQSHKAKSEEVEPGAIHARRHCVQDKASLTGRRSPPWRRDRVLRPASPGPTCIHVRAVCLKPVGFTTQGVRHTSGSLLMISILQTSILPFSLGKSSSDHCRRYPCVSQPFQASPHLARWCLDRLPSKGTFRH